MKTRSDWATEIVVAAALLLPAPLIAVQPESNAMPGGRLDLVDHHGQHWSLKTSHGKVVILSFGYTSCPDVCPITLGIVGSVLRDLGPRADEVRALFVSLDPERDTRERLREYVQYFHPAIVGLTGSQDQLGHVRRQFKVTYARRHTGDSKTYTVDHTSHIYLLDLEGQVSRIVPLGLPPEHLKAQVLELLDSTAPLRAHSPDLVHE